MALSGELVCLTVVSNLQLIRRVPLFSMLAAAQAETVAAAVIKRRDKRGESIVEQGKQSMRWPSSSPGEPAW